MSSSKESDLVTAILMYVTRCAAEGDQLALREMKFGEKELQAIANLNLLDLPKLEALKTHCLKIQLNQQVFWPIIEHLHRTREQEKSIQQLLLADAPLEMMNTLFGMSSREFTGRRKKLAIEPGVGRPPLPDSDREYELYTKWTEMTRNLASEDLQGNDYLRLHKDSTISMRAIWQLTQRWSDYPQIEPRNRSKDY